MKSTSFLLAVIFIIGLLLVEGQRTPPPFEELCCKIYFIIFEMELYSFIQMNINVFSRQLPI